MDIQRSIDQFLNGSGKNRGRKAVERYASFDYCYNYFYTFYKNGKTSELSNEDNIQMSCLQLGFYLASWGMMRGSSFLLEKSVKNYSTLINTISEMNPLMWEIDIPYYDEENIDNLINCKDEIYDSLGKENNPSDTLITKIMLGVFGNIPAFDQYFRRSMKVYTVNKQSLIKIRRFYEENKNLLDTYNIHTFDFNSGRETEIKYTMAKLIDMCGFMDGQ